MADEQEDKDDSLLTSGDFHTIAQKQIMNAVFATLAETKMQWNVIAPLLEAGRGVCVGDFVENARVRLHTTRAEGEGWIEAEEAYLGISVADRDQDEEWLSETYWLSELATQDATRAEVEAAIAALERTIAKLRLWLENGGPASPGTVPELPPA